MLDDIKKCVLLFCSLSMDGVNCKDGFNRAQNSQQLGHYEHISNCIWCLCGCLCVVTNDHVTG
jgi:hypothetical protein